MIGRILLSGFLLLSLGTSQAQAKELFTFAGSIDFTSNKFNMDVDFEDDSFIRAKGLKTIDDDYQLDVDIEHVKSPFFDLSSQIQGNLAFNNTSQKILGDLSSQYSLVNYKPIQELSGQFEIKDNKIFFNSLSFANVAWNGYVEYSHPYTVDLVVEMDKVPMTSFLAFWVPHNRFESSGLVSGEIKLLGSLNELQLRGNLQAAEGHIESLKYDNIHLTASGLYPNIEVTQTVVSRMDGMSFIVNGPVNISDAHNFKKQIKALDVAPLVNQTASTTEWTIKRLQGSDSTSTEFKYLFRDDPAKPNPSNSEDAAMLGVEQKLEF